MLMTHRPATMVFGPGLHVFPGGAVDPGDRDADGGLAARSVLDAGECSRRWAGDLGPGEALGHAVAAIRELYEEAGVLLARDRDGSWVDPALVAAAAEAGEPLDRLAGRLDLRLATDALLPMTRWVTPPTADVSRRYDTRFYVADLPPGAEVLVDRREVVTHDWITPSAALEAWAERRIELWPPTSATLLQLGSARSAGDVGRRLRPSGPSPAPRIEVLAPHLRRCRLGAAGGVPGLRRDAWLVGERRIVIIDPGDPGEPALDALLEATTRDGRRLAAVVLTSAMPEHAAGAVGLALVAGAPLLASPRAAALVGEPCLPLADQDAIDGGDVPLTAAVVAGAPDGALEIEAPSLVRKWRPASRRSRLPRTGRP